MAEVKKLGRDIKVQVAVERYDVIGGSSNGDGAVGKGLGALKARLSLVQSGQHVEYTVRVDHAGKSWTLRKRFNEVAALHDAIKKILPWVPDMPAKSVVRQFSPEYLEARKAALTGYLQELVRRREVINCQEVQQFLGLPQNCPAAFGMPHGSEPMRAAEVHDSSFGVVDFVYDPVQGLLLMGASDASWTSRMDTKITNIKLPWEPAAPNLPISQMSLWKQSPADLRFEVVFMQRYTSTISCVCLAMLRDKGLCLCGLSDGTVGCHAVQGNSGIAGVGAMGTTLPLLRHTASVKAIAFDEADQWVITASKDNAVMVYSLNRQMIECEVQTPAPTATMTYCQAQKRLFTGLQNGKVVIWDLSTLPMRQVGTIPDGQSAAATGGAIELANTKISALDYDSVTSTLFMAAKEGVTLWAVKSSNLCVWGRKAGAVPAASNAPTAIAWANSSREIIAGFAGGSVVVFDVDAGEASYAFQAHQDEVSTIQWLDAPRRLLTSSKDKTLKIWDFPSLRRMPLEDNGFITAPTPTVSMAAQSRTSRDQSSGVPIPGQRDAAGAAKPRGATSFDPKNPLAGGRSASGSFTATSQSGYPSASYTSSPTASAPPPPPLDPLAAAGAPSAGRPAPAPVAGARPGATLRADSDDEDLSGWAR